MEDGLSAGTDRPRRQSACRRTRHDVAHGGRGQYLTRMRHCAAIAAAALTAAPPMSSPAIPLRRCERPRARPCPAARRLAQGEAAVQRAHRPVEHDSDAVRAPADFRPRHRPQHGPMMSRNRPYDRAMTAPSGDRPRGVGDVDGQHGRQHAIGLVGAGRAPVRKSSISSTTRRCRRPRSDGRLPSSSTCRAPAMCARDSARPRRFTRASASPMEHQGRHTHARQHGRTSISAVHPRQRDRPCRAGAEPLEPRPPVAEPFVLRAGRGEALQALAGAPVRGHAERRISRPLARQHPGGNARRRRTGSAPRVRSG